MTKLELVKDGPPDKPDKYDYFRGLSSEEIAEHLKELSEGFEEVKGHYNGPLGSFRKKLKEEDSEKLVDALWDLLPMGHNPHVQQELISGSVEDPEDLVFNRISMLSNDILRFTAGFEDSGVTLIQPPLGLA